MPFRHLLPLVDEMARQKAQATLSAVSVARLAQADPKDSNVRAAIADLERRAGRDAPAPVTQSLESVRAMMTGAQEV